MEMDSRVYPPKVEAQDIRLEMGIPETPEESSWSLWTYVPLTALVVRNSLGTVSDFFSFKPTGFSKLIGALKVFNAGYVKTEPTEFEKIDLAAHANKVGDTRLELVALSQLNDGLAWDASNTMTAAIGLTEAIGHTCMSTPSFVTGALGVTRVGAAYAATASHQMANDIVERLNSFGDDKQRLTWLKSKLMDPAFKLAVGEKAIKAIREASSADATAIMSFVRHLIGREQVSRQVQTLVAITWLVRWGVKWTAPEYAPILTTFMATAEVGLAYYKSRPIDDPSKLL